VQEQLTFQNLCDTVPAVYADERELLSVQIARAYDDAVKRAAQFNASSELTLRLKFEPKNEHMTVSAEIKTKLPGPSSLPINAWVDRKGNLVLEDPSQTKIPFPVRVQGEGEGA